MAPRNIGVVEETIQAGTALALKHLGYLALPSLGSWASVARDPVFYRLSL